MPGPPGSYVPDYVVSLGGRPMPAELRGSVTSVRFDEALEGANRVELQMATPDLRLLEHDLLRLDAQLELSLGYRPGNLRPVFKGDVTGVEPSFPSGGVPTVTISAHDYLRRLSEGTKQRGFPFYMTDSLIATIVAAENQLLTEPDPAAAVLTGLGIFSERPRYQHKQSDYDFLRQIAAEYGFDMWVDGDVLNFKLLLRELPPSEVELRWGESLVEFAPRLTSIGQILKVTVRVWVEVLKTQLSVQVSWDGERISTRVVPALFGEQAEPVEATLTLPDIPLDSPVDAIKWALAELRRRINSRVTGRGSAVGDPRIRAGEVITLSGLGPRFSGRNYRLTSVAHSFDGGGYRTAFEARQELV